MASGSRSIAASVRHNSVEGRFEIELDGALSVLMYEESAGQLVALHTVVPEFLAGRGIGSQLAVAALNYARSRGLKVVPECSFVAGLIARHPEYADLLR